MRRIIVQSNEIKLLATVFKRDIWFHYIRNCMIRINFRSWFIFKNTFDFFLYRSCINNIDLSTPSAKCKMKEVATHLHLYNRQIIIYDLLILCLKVEIDTIFQWMIWAYDCKFKIQTLSNIEINYTS